MPKYSEILESKSAATDMPVRASLPAIMCPEWLQQRCEKALALLEETGAVWIDGPPGAGKTLLAAVMSGSRQGRAVSAWLRLTPADREPGRLVEDIDLALKAAGNDAPASSPAVVSRSECSTTLGRLVAAQLARISPCTMVLDAAEETGPDGPLPELLESLITARAAGSQLLVTSRLPLPPQLARLREEGRIARIDGDMLRLSFDEALILARTTGVTDSNTVRIAHDEAEGWLAGFQALLRQHQNGEDRARFDEYLEQELLADLLSAERELLFMLAPLAVIPHAVIDQIDPEQGLSCMRRLVRENRLVREHEAGFQCHPLLAEHLQRSQSASTAVTVDPRQRSRLGDALYKAGFPEEAVEQWLAAAAWAAAGRAILELAPGLVRVGAHARVRDWLARMPESVCRPGSRLHLWYGLAQVPLDAGIAQEVLETALASLREAGDDAGAALAWTGLVERAWLEWGDFSPAAGLLDDLDRLATVPIEHLEPLAAARLTAAAVLLIGLLVPGDPRRQHWLNAAGTAARMELPDGERLGILHVLLAMDTWVWGDRARAYRSLEQGRVMETRGALPPLHEQMWHAAVAGYHLWFDADPAVARERIEYALERAGEHGFDLWNFQLEALGACAALRNADEDRAREWLERTRRTSRPAQATDASFRAWVCGWVALRDGDVAGAAIFAEEARDLIEGRGPRNAQLLARLAVARSRRLQGRPRAALADAVAIDRIAREFGSPLYQWLARLIAAQALTDCGRPRWADRLLARTLSDGQERGFMCVPWCSRDELNELCGRGAELGVAPQYLRTLARVNGLPDWSPAWHAAPQAWPLRLHALGPLRVQTENGEVQIVGKGERLLRWLAAAGSAGLSEAQVMDELWPDADGDRARRSFDTLLHRLRRRLGMPDALRLDAGRLHLDSALCWTDVAVMERLLDKAVGGNMSAWHKALALAEDAGAPAQDWPAKDNTGGLSRHFAVTAEKVVRHLRDSGKTDAAIEAVRHARTIDPLHESFYMKLMQERPPKR